MLSKLTHQIGKAFSILGILQALLPVVTKPAFAILYQVAQYLKRQQIMQQ